MQAVICETRSYSYISHENWKQQKNDCLTTQTTQSTQKSQKS